MPKEIIVASTLKEESKKMHTVESIALHLEKHFDKKYVKQQEEN